MDDSEYELMKETKKLLELALKKEEDLNSEIKRLNNEKIEILEKSQKSISIITKTVRTDHVISIDGKGNEKIESYLINKFNEYRQYLRNGWDYILYTKDISDIINRYFKTVTNESEPNKSYKLVGLDEAKEELKELLRNELDSETKEKLQELTQTRLDFNLSKIYWDSKESQYKTEIEALAAERDLIQYHHDDIQKMLKVELWKDSSLMMIRDTAEHATFWNRNKSIKRILELTNKPKEDGISS